LVRAIALALLAGGCLIGPAAAQTAPSAASASTAVASVSAEAFAAARERVIATLQTVSQVDGAPPAVAIVMVRRGEPPVIWVNGPLDATAYRRVAANADTPFYIASQTKAFTGLTALILHDRGIFSLDQSLADVWPDLTLPEGADPRAITFRMLLSHQGVIENEPLSVRTADTDLVPAANYPRLLANYSTVREPGYLYTNVGYLIYSAALETYTGRDWRSWMESELLRPAGLTRTSPRTSIFNARELPRYHQWLGGANWVVHNGKPDATMQAAGGMVTTPNDMAHWLSLQLGNTSGAVSAEVLAESQRMQIAADIQESGLRCQGYAVGWNICRIGAVDVHLHGGGFTAVRSVMSFSRELGVGFAFMSNSDSLTGALSRQLAQAFFETVQNPTGGGQAPEEIAAQYGARLAEFLENRRSAVAERRAEAQWEGWAWRPRASDLRRYTGRFHSPAYGDMHIRYRDGALRAQLGIMQISLEPAKADLFGFGRSEIDPPVPLQFHRDGNTRITALTWEGHRFERVG
jgi:CubicO group peptidase (beta-lactamase class C family)